MMVHGLSSHLLACPDIVVEFARPLRKDLLAIRNKKRIHADSERRSRSGRVLLARGFLRCFRMSFASYPDRRYPVVVTNIPSRVCWQVGITILFKDNP